jgi:peptidoglycan/xylan/chitin deacetylase (PgdA/CDA1 family)
MKIFTRRIVLFFLYVFYLFTRIFVRRKEAAVLMYHSIADSDWFFSVPPRDFEHQMRYLKENFNPVKLRDVAEFVRGERELPPRSVAITFDDGYEDFYTNALPILEKYKIPATLFVIAGEPDRKELGNNFALLGWDKIREIKTRGLVEIGSHALTHKKLTRLNPEEAENELKASRVIIERESGALPYFLAYPKGNFNSAAREMAQKSGFSGAVTAVQRLVKKGGDPYVIPRIQIDRSTSFWEFKIKLTRSADWYYKLWAMVNVL